MQGGDRVEHADNHVSGVRSGEAGRVAGLELRNAGRVEDAHGLADAITIDEGRALCLREAFGQIRHELGFESVAVIFQKFHAHVHERGELVSDDFDLIEAHGRGGAGIGFGDPCRGGAADALGIGDGTGANRADGRILAKRGVFAQKLDQLAADLFRGEVAAGGVIGRDKGGLQIFRHALNATASEFEEGLFLDRLGFGGVSHDGRAIHARFELVEAGGEFGFNGRQIGRGGFDGLVFHGGFGFLWLGFSRAGGLGVSDPRAGMARDRDGGDLQKIKRRNVATAALAGRGLAGGEADRESGNGALADQGAHFTGARNVIDQEAPFDGEAFVGFADLIPHADNLLLIVRPENREGCRHAGEGAFLDHVADAISRTEGPCDALDRAGVIDRERGLDLDPVHQAASPFSSASTLRSSWSLISISVGRAVPNHAVSRMATASA